MALNLTTSTNLRTLKKQEQTSIETRAILYIDSSVLFTHPPVGRGWVLGSIFAGYHCAAGLPSLKPLPAYPIMNYSVANYRPNVCHFWTNVSFAIPTLSLYGTVESEIGFRIAGSVLYCIF